MSRPRRPLPISTLLARLGTVAGIALAVYTVVTLIGFLSQRSYLPAGSTLGGLDVSGLTAQEATLAIDQALGVPLTIRLPDNPPLTLAPGSLDFAVDGDATRSQIERALGAHYALSNFPARLLRQSGAPPRLDPVTRHDAGKLGTMLDTLAQNNDRPAAQGVINPETLQPAPGAPGIALDKPNARARVAQALQTAAPPASRAIELPFDGVSAPPSAPAMIEAVARARLDAFVADAGKGGIGALYLKDLATGEELAINADIALSAQAWLRWAVALENARVADSVDGPATRALLQNGPEFNHALGRIGNGDTQAGADQVSTLLRELGLTSSFLAQPPGAAQRPPVIVTPANARGDINTNPDPVAQSTAAEIGLLLEMIDSCQRNTGPLVLNYPGLFTSAKCGALLGAFGANPAQGLIDAASPGAVVIQRQNWTGNLHASAALVRAQGRGYVIVIALSAPGALDWQRTSPVITDIARAAFAALTGQGAPAVAPLTAAPAH